VEKVKRSKLIVMQTGCTLRGRPIYIAFSEGGSFAQVRNEVKPSLKVGNLPRLEGDYGLVGLGYDLP